MVTVKESDYNKGETKDRVKKNIGFSVDNMDRSVDPLRDFYSYASGNWVKKNSVPTDKSSWNSFLELMEDNNDRLREILESCRNGENEGNNGSAKLLGDFYTSAMNVEVLEEVRFEPVKPYMDLVEGLSTRDDLAEILAGLHLYGISPFFNIISQTDEKNSEIYAFFIHQGGLALPDRDYYLSENFSETREKYREHVNRIFSIYGYSVSEAAKASKYVLSIESDIAKASRSRADLRDAEKNYNRLQISEIREKFKSLDISGYLGHLNLPKVEYVVVGQPEFLQSVEGMISSMPIEGLRAYLAWNVLHSAAPFLFSEIQEENFDMFGRTIMGQKEQEPRWKRSVRVIDQQIGEALGELYVGKYFGPEARERMARMVEDIREVFRDRLHSLEWMTDETKKQAISKFEKFTTKIGHPARFRDYSSVFIKNDDFFGNVCRAEAFEMRREIDRTGKPVDRDEWWMTPPTVNAYFSPPDNEIVFPAGILQPPFFDTEMDIAVNYGAIGSVISHEITHGYDDQGRRYDEKGNLRDWWTKEDESNFMERAKDVIDLYSSMEILPGIHVNGELTLGENIADFGGVRIAFEALQRRLTKEPDLRKSADGLTPEQRFFISYGQVWKENILEPMQKMLATVDPHSPNRFRATLPVYSHRAFEETFGPLSSSGSPPLRKKIDIW